MTIWILAFFLMTAAALAGWRQGAIQASINFFGILIAALLSGVMSKIFGWILPHLGVSSPVTAWIFAPICGFILLLVIFMAIGQAVHRKVEMFYKYKAGDLRLTLWERLNSRLGICVGLMNGAAYFILVSFLLFNFSYVTSQTAVASPSAMIRLVNSAGADLQSTGMAHAAAAVGTLPPMFYKLADTSGFLMQNPQAAQRLVDYPGLASLWERDEMQPLVQDSALTNAIAAGTSVNDVLNMPSVQDFIHNEALSKSVWNIVQTNFTDLTNYLATGKSAKYDGEKIIGHWEFNPAVTFAWMRQDRPRMSNKEVIAYRQWMMQSFAQTRLLLTGDNQIFVRSFPRVRTGAGQTPPTTELNNWKGDWSNDGKTYSLHIQLESEEKFLTATTEGIRLTVKDGKNTYIFDKVE